MRIETLLRDEIKDEFEKLKKLEMGSEEHDKVLNGLTKLLDREIEYKKVNLESEERNEARQSDEYFKEQQMRDERKDRKIKNAIAIGSIIIPVVVTIWGTVKSFEFEKEGTITTIMGRGFINKLLPKK